MARRRQAARRPGPDLPPDRRPLTDVGAARLAKLAGVDAKELVGRPIAELAESLRWRIDPELLLFRRVCGQVVRKDPATGKELPVPFATVHVEDTDCGLLGYFPPGWPFGWYFPFFCRREEIGTVKTDACGRFCVFVPRFEIDWILRFRRRRICFPIIFERPRLVDILERLPLPIPHWPPIRPPRPEPDPPPFLLEDGGLTLRRAEGLIGPELVERLGAAQLAGEVGASAEVSLDLAGDVPDLPLPPPLPQEMAQKLEGVTELESVSAKFASLDRDQRALLERELPRLDPQRFIGPFWRCRDVFVPQWLPIFDVPDVTFRVTQDVDGDGDEETIYSEGYFDVRWNTGWIPPVKLVASQIALTAPACDGPEVPCEDEPAIVLAGLHPLHNPAAPPPYHDNGTGYARRPNRPHPSALMSDPPPNPEATAPYAGTVQLYGCNHGLGGQYYRLRYSYQGAPSVPFLGHSWKLVRIGPGGVLQQLSVAPDGAGWYEIVDPAQGWLPAHLLLNWPTTSSADGYYEIVLELGDGSKNPISTSDPVGIRVDNSTPAGSFTGLFWRLAGQSGWPNDLELTCPVIFRPKGQMVEIRVDYLASANHLRSVQLFAGGCGGGAPAQLAAPNWSEPPTPAFVGGVSQSPYAHWHTGPADNALARSGVYSLAGAAPQGAYSFSLYVASRAFNPAGGDGGFEADWEYNPVVRWRWSTLNVAVVDV